MAAFHVHCHLREICLIMSRQRHRPQGFQRTDRIADFIQRELSQLIRTEMKDPRLGLVTIQDVRVARDLSTADVYFTLLNKSVLNESVLNESVLNESVLNESVLNESVPGEDASAVPQAEEVLTHAAGFLRSALAKSLNARTTPRLRFHYDTLPEQASHMEGLLRQVREQDDRINEDASGDDASSFEEK
jgi:ribosome-binding factor A